MEMKPGYKQTEVGVIPEDWECTTVSQLVREGVLEKPLDGNHGNIHPKSGDFVGFGIPFVMANNVQGGHVDLSNCAFIRKEQADSLRKGFSQTGDVLLTHKATIGNTAIVGEIPFEYIMLTPQVTYYRVADQSRLNNFYLRLFFDSSAFQSVLLSMSGGGTRAYIGITAQLQLPVILPPTKAEQEAISEVLNDADALIKSLEQFIAKKRNLKQGAMQELLTGKKRLPGFSEEWEVKALGEIATANKGNQLSSSALNEHGRFAHLNGGISPSGYTDKSNVPRDTIAISEGGNSCGYVQFMLEPFWCGGHCYAVIPNGIDNRYLYHALKGEESSIMGLRVGSGLPNVQKTAILAFKLRCPNTSEEQSAIAAILSDMDTEIALLESKLAKSRRLKKGMMHELLTGRIRLV